MGHCNLLLSHPFCIDILQYLFANVKHEFQNVPNIGFGAQTPCKCSEPIVLKINFSPRAHTHTPAVRWQFYWKSHNSPSCHSFCTRGQKLTGCTPSTSQFGLGDNPHAPNSPTFPSIRASKPPETRTFPTNPGRNPSWEFSVFGRKLPTSARGVGEREVLGCRECVGVRVTTRVQSAVRRRRAGMKNRDWRRQSLPL